MHTCIHAYTYTYTHTHTYRSSPTHSLRSYIYSCIHIHIHTHIQLIADTFTEMVLCWGHVHGDPHAGNIYICAEKKGVLGGVKPRLVMLDHGLYHSMDDDLRTDMCRLFTACVTRDRPEIARLSQRIAGPMHRFYPLLLSPW